MAGMKVKSSKSMAAGLVTLRWKKMKAAFADACAKLLAPHILADAVHRGRVRPALPPTATSHVEPGRTKSVEANGMEYVANVAGDLLGAANNREASSLASGYLTSVEAKLHSHKEVDVSEESRKQVEFFTTDLSEELHCPSDLQNMEEPGCEIGPLCSSESHILDSYGEMYIVKKAGDGFEGISEIADNELVNSEGVDGEGDEIDGDGLDDRFLGIEASGDWNEGFHSVIEEELEDILAGLHRRLSGLRAGSHHGKKYRESSLTAISEESLEKMDDDEEGEMFEEQRLRKLNGSICNLTGRHGNRTKELQEEGIQIEELKSTLSEIRFADRHCAAAECEGEGVAGARIWKDKGIIFEEPDRKGRENGGASVSSTLNTLQSKLVEGRGLAFESGRDREGSSCGSEQLMHLHKAVTGMKTLFLEREQQFRRQREELSQLWRTASELGQKVAVERCKTRTEKERADQAEALLETSRLSELNLKEQLNAQAQKNSQLKIARACLCDQDCRKREEELEGTVAKLQASKAALEGRVADWEAQGEKLEKEAAKIKKENKVLMAKLGWMAKSKKELQEEVRELTALASKANHIDNFEMAGLSQDEIEESFLKSVEAVKAADGTKLGFRNYFSKGSLLYGSNTEPFSFWGAITDSESLASASSTVSSLSALSPRSSLDRWDNVSSTSSSTFGSPTSCPLQLDPR